MNKCSNGAHASERSDAYTSKTLESYLNLYRYRAASRYVMEASTLLDVGTGYGYGVHYLDSASNSNLSIGIDISTAALKYANERYRGERRCFIQCSATHLPFQDKIFDLITCLEVIEHVRTPSMVLDEIHRTLKINGKLIISTPNRYTIGSLLRQKSKDEPPRNPFHVHEYSIPEFRELLKREEFSVIHKMGIYTPIPRVRKVKGIRNSYLYSRLSCHAFSFLQRLCRYQQYVCTIRPRKRNIDKPVLLQTTKNGE